MAGEERAPATSPDGGRVTAPARDKEAEITLADGRVVETWWSILGHTWCQVTRRNGHRVSFTVGHTSRTAAISHGKAMSE